MNAPFLLEKINLPGYLLFAFITSITPGPNNILLLSIGKYFGFKKAIPAMVGMFFGFIGLLSISGYGITGLIRAVPALELTLKIVSSIWLTILAFLIRHIGRVPESESIKPIGFFTAVMLQFVNPKAWAMAVNGAAAFLPKFSNPHLNVFLYAAIFGLVGIPCMISWVSLGQLLTQFVNSARRNAILGTVLFVLMIFTVVTIWI